MLEEMTTLDIDEIQYDYENPRIKGALEKYGDNLTPERIHFALQSSSDGEKSSSSSFRNLKMSIKAHGGITEPIKVVEKDGHYACIDGNTRLAIYSDFAKQDTSSNWNKIRCRLLRNATELDIESIRITSHLVGARPWPAYEKAKYLSHLRFHNFMDYDELIALCGGSKSEIERYIEAFDDMNNYYRAWVEDGDFKIDRFSGFVELQKQGIKDAIFNAGFELNDFGSWIHNGNISALADVRRLPKVLRDSDARKVLHTGGVNSFRKAENIVDEKFKPPIDPVHTVEDADPETLAYELNKKLKNMNLDEISGIRASEGTVTILEELSERLSELLDYVRK